MFRKKPSKKLDAKNIKVYDITPDTSLMNKISKQGYSINQAIQELVDNSIDAAKENEKVIVNIKYDGKRDECIIEDNCSGMSSEELGSAWTIAKSDKKEKMGLYGFGLKQASINLGDYIKIETSKKDSDAMSILEYDNEKWSKTNNNWKIEVEETPTSTEIHGTRITIRKLNRSSFPKNSETRLSIRLGDNYESLINSGVLEIYLNKLPCLPEGINSDIEFGEKLEEYEGIFGRRIKLDCKKFSIKGFVSVMITGDSSKTGFKTLRYKRIITKNDKFNKQILTDHPSQVRIFGVLDLTPLEVNFNKTGWVKNEDYIRFLDALEKCKELREAKDYSRVKYNRKNIEKIDKKSGENINNAFNEGLKNDYIKDALETTDIFKNTIKTRMIRNPQGEKVISEIRKERKFRSDNMDNIISTNNGKTRTNFEKSQLLPKKPISTKIKGKNLIINTSWEDLGNNEKILLWAENNPGILDVYMNARHKLLSRFKSAEAVELIQIKNIAHALTEFVIRHNLAEEFQEDFYEKILSVVSDYLYSPSDSEIEDSKLK